MTGLGQGAVEGPAMIRRLTSTRNGASCGFIRFHTGNEQSVPWESCVCLNRHAVNDRLPSPGCLFELAEPKETAGRRNFFLACNLDVDSLWLVLLIAGDINHSCNTATGNTDT
jgi:hypothetical protein